MIVAERKPFDELVDSIKDFRRVLIVGCGTCVAVCLAGGEKEAGLLAAEFDIAAQIADRDQSFAVACVERQCDREFLDELNAKVPHYDALLSLACGAGIQFLAEKFPDKPVLAGVNTTFIGVNEDVGLWAEKCRACRNCVLTMTGGICPVALCPKGLLNGPCGGMTDGRCETDPERECAWVAIYQRLEHLGRLDNIRPIAPPRAYGRAGLPGRQVHAAYERRYRANA